MTSYQDPQDPQDDTFQVVPQTVQVANPTYAPVPATRNNSLVYGSVNVGSLRIPNIVLIILIVVIAWLLWTNKHTIHKLTPKMVGGALETSSSPTSSFFDNIRL